MPQFLSALQDQLDTTRNIVVFALIMVRVMAIVILTPWLGGRNAPPEVKMGIGVTLTMVLWPTAILGAADGVLPVTPVAFVMMMLKEAFIGLVIGFVTAEIFYTVEMSGQLIDMLRGANQIQVQVPEITERSSAFGALQYQLLLALVLSLDLHRLMIISLFESFIAIPINQWPGLHAGYWPFVDAMMRISGDIFITGTMLAMPVGIVCLITETAFGLINRVAPQINAYFMAMPAKVMAGIMIFFVATQMVIEQMIRWAADLLGRIDMLIELLR